MAENIRLRVIFLLLQTPSKLSAVFLMIWLISKDTISRSVLLVSNLLVLVDQMLICLVYQFHLLYQDIYLHITRIVPSMIASAYFIEVSGSKIMRYISNKLLFDNHQAYLFHLP